MAGAKKNRQGGESGEDLAMPHADDLAIRHSGTRVRLFAQSHYLDAFREPEVVWLAPPAGSVGPGPSDDRMYVVDPLGKEEPYQFPVLPPWSGPAYPPVLPDAEGHFDHFPVNSREFVVTHMYGGIRRVLDIWECYFGRRIEWHFRPHFNRLELVPVLDWDNAHAGYGFIETGFGPSQAGEARPYSLNFDVLAHELGHSIVFAEADYDPATLTGEYLGFQEAMGDLIALVSALHFDSVLDQTLVSSRGNLYAENETNRLGELSECTQIRLASNPIKLSEFESGWSKPHDLGLPLVGAVFDCLVDVYQDRLLRAGLIDAGLIRLIDMTPFEELDEGIVQARFAEAYMGRHEDFKLALMEARDYIGHCMVSMMTGTSPRFLRYAEVGETLLLADRNLSGGRYQEQFFENLVWRHIGTAVVGPRVPARDEDASRERIDLPFSGGGRCAMT